MQFTRRGFGRAAGLGLAASSLPLFGRKQSPDTSGRRLGYCIVGLGRISLGHFMPACKMSQYSKVVALVSGHIDKAQKTAAQYSVKGSSIYNYQNFDDIRDNKEIEAVYIALPNSMHAEYTIRAAKAGKHVLCEKPMATSVKDSEAMIAACRAANVKLFIAYRCQYEPANLRAIELIRNGKLGTIQAIESANGFNIKPGEWRLDRAMSGGGPLLDVGIYSLNACRYLTGEEPAEIKGSSSVVDRDGRFNTVEENDAWVMRFPSGVVAACTTTYGANMPGFYRVHGSKGMLHCEPAFSYEGVHMKVQIQKQQPFEVSEPSGDPSQFVAEADAFAQDIWSNREPKTNGEEGLRDMKYMEQIYLSAGIK